MESAFLDCAPRQLLELVLHLIEVFLLALSLRVDVLAQLAKLLDLLDLTLHDVQHLLQVFVEVGHDFRLLLFCRSEKRRKGQSAGV